MLLSEFLTDHAHGELDREAGAALAEVADAVAMLDKAGTLTVEIRMEKTGGRLLVSGKTKAKAPEPAAEAGLYFVTADGGLSKDDPLQLSLGDVIDPFADEDDATVDIAGPPPGVSADGEIL